jgi:hypothetical protein
MTPHDHDDLAWLAFRYVAGELDRDEAADFEHRLDAEQSAREAVAEAVAMAEALALAGSRKKGSLRLVRSAGVVLAAAACLFLAISLWLFAPGKTRSEPDAGAASVALSWSGLRQNAEIEHRDDLFAWLEEPSAEAPSEGDTDSQDTADGPPGWLLEAASLRDTLPAPSPGY